MCISVEGVVGTQVGDVIGFTESLVVGDRVSRLFGFAKEAVFGDTFRVFVGVTVDLTVNVLVCNLVSVLDGF